MTDKGKDKDSVQGTDTIAKAESYVFVPIYFEKQDDIKSLLAECRRQKDERSEGTNNAAGDDYLLEYVVKHNKSDTYESGQYGHIDINPVSFFKGKRAETDEKRSEIELTAKNNNFTLSNISLYVFSTGIGMLAYQFAFNNIEIHSLYRILFDLKLASKTNTMALSNQNDLAGFKTKDNSQQTFNIEDISNAVCSSLELSGTYNLFFYCQETAKKCNVLTMYEENNIEDVSGNLKYLMYGYDSAAEKREEDIFQVSGSQFWCVSSEGAVCAARSAGKRERSNFDNHALMVFVLALHQKYELYHFLMVISENLYGQTVSTEEEHQKSKEISRLKKYREELSLFEKDFSFNVITEIPVYQMIYEELRKAFCLQKMYRDVHEPLTKLNILHKEEQEDTNEKHDRVIDRILAVITSATLFSVILDFTNLLKELFYGDKEMPAVITGTSSTEIRVIILAALIILLIVLLKAVILPLHKAISGKNENS